MKYYAILLMAVTAPLVAENPVPYTEDSVSHGSQIYLQYCTGCHGKDGRAQIDVISDATDLTEPDAYYNGATQDDMFNSIRNGAGVGMPAWSRQIENPADAWHLVNFIRSLWTESQRKTNK